MEPIGISFYPAGDFSTHPDHVFPMVANSHKSRNLKIKNRVGFGRTEVSVHQTKALRELFRMGMVSGVLVFKGFAKVRFFMILGSFLTVFHGHSGMPKFESLEKRF